MAIGGSKDTVRGRMDWLLVWAAGALMVIGTLAVLSASAQTTLAHQVFVRQFVAIGVGILAFIFGLGLNYQVYQDQARSCFAIGIVLLIAVLLFGSTLRGTRGWFKLPFLSFQPSEVANLFTIFMVSDHLVRRQRRMADLSTVLGTFFLVLPVLVLILVEPNLSATLVLFPAVLAMLFCAGARVSHLAGLAGCGFLSFILPLVWTYLGLHPERTAGGFGRVFFSLHRFGLPFLGALLALALLLWAGYWLFNELRHPLPWYVFAAVFLVVGGGMTAGVVANKVLKEYQRRRFISFVSPEADPRGSSYNLRQSQIAIGSGGFWGKGLFSGTQSQLGFLPERHTDFIFSVIGEETGFLGAFATLGLYLFLLWRLVRAARAARDDFGYLAACGLAGLFGFHLLINTGMAVGLLPVAGVPLPLVSYGGSSMVTSLWALGIVESIYTRRARL